MAAYAVLGPFVKGSVMKFLGSFAGSFVADSFEDALSQVLRRIDWAKLAASSPRIIKQVFGAILNVVPEGFYSPQTFSAITSVMRGAIEGSRLSPAAKRALDQILDSIGDEVRDLITDGKFTEAKQALQSYANGITQAAGASMTTPSAPAAGSTMNPIHLQPWQRRSMALFDAIVVGASISQDVLEVERARQIYTRYKNVTGKNPWLLNQLPGGPGKKWEAWFTEGFRLLDKLADVWTERASFAREHPRDRSYFENADNVTEVLVRKIQRRYVDEYRPFMRLVDMTSEHGDGKLGDGVEALGAKLGDWFDNYLDNEGRENWRKKGGQLVELAHEGSGLECCP